MLPAGHGQLFEGQCSLLDVSAWHSRPRPECCSPLSACDKRQLFARRVKFDE
jgi:hypothetical protein